MFHTLSACYKTWNEASAHVHNMKASLKFMKTFKSWLQFDWRSVTHRQKVFVAGQSVSGRSAGRSVGRSFSRWLGLSSSLLQLQFVSLQLRHEAGVRIDHITSYLHLLEQEQQLSYWMCLWNCNHQTVTCDADADAERKVHKSLWHNDAGTQGQTVRAAQRHFGNRYRL